LYGPSLVGRAIESIERNKGQPSVDNVQKVIEAYLKKREAIGRARLLNQTLSKELGVNAVVGAISE